jgi:hypothetical protein
MFETFSKRQRQKERAGEPDVYQYDDLPRAFRNQVVWIWSRALGPYYDARGYAMSQLDALHGALHGFYPHHDTPLSNQLWDLIARTLAEDLGVFSIGQSRASSFDQCVSFLQSANTDGALDTIDLSFRIVNNLRAQPQGMRSASGIMLDPDEAIALLNTRFREHRIGYEFVSGELVRIDEQFIHQQVVKPALALLADSHFTGANDEFLRAHEHYRKQEYKDAIVDAGNAFESTMKAICDLRSWTYPSGATASTLIKTLIDHGLLDEWYESILTSLATLRNKTTGAHGQGSSVTIIAPHTAAYTLHLAAANIVVLIETHIAAP